MIIYGEHERVEEAAVARAEVAQALGRVGRVAKGPARHAALVSAFIRAGELVQGLADAEFETRGQDEPSPSRDACARLLARIAGAVDRSWRDEATPDDDPEVLGALVDALGPSGSIRTRVAEGYAHYGLYPESYLEAARASGLGSNTIVIGLRSIGAGLGALVAAAIGAAPAISLRPSGPPFAREIRADPAILGALAGDGSRFYAVVDEGPGLSGSSMASVAKWLMGLGVGLDRMRFFPSHAGAPGASASPSVRDIWSRVLTHPADAHDMAGHPRGLRRWIEAEVGPLVGAPFPLELAVMRGTGTPQDWRFTPRKFVGETATSRFLAKFAGLGPIGERRFADASVLDEAGFGPHTVALCHGYVLQRWIEGAPAVVAAPRAALLDRIGDYLAFRARNLGPPGPGASLEKLAEMAVHNCSEALGDAAGAQLAKCLRGATALQQHVRPMRTDNRMHAWKWLSTDGVIVKLDGVDHCVGHDLIGCQDVAWDVAGAKVEFDLTPHEIRALTEKVGTGTGSTPHSDLIAFLEPCYLAFQLGLWATATPASSENAEFAERYAGKLRRWLRRDQS